MTDPRHPSGHAERVELRRADQERELAEDLDGNVLALAHLPARPHERAQDVGRRELELLAPHVVDRLSTAPQLDAGTVDGRVERVERTKE